MRHQTCHFQVSRHHAEAMTLYRDSLENAPSVTGPSGLIHMQHAAQACKPASRVSRMRNEDQYEAANLRRMDSGGGGNNRYCSTEMCQK